MRVIRFAVHQTSKTMAALYALLGLVLIPLLFLANWVAPTDQKLPGWLVIASPVLYGVFAYIFISLGCLVYNFMARFTGGVEFDTSPPPPSN